MIRLNDVWKSYRLGETEVQALRGVTTRLAKGEFTLLLGPSGSGKSSLLHILGAMDRPSKGSVEFGGADLARLSSRQRTAFRLKTLGFVFQTFNLIPTLTALENVALPMRLMGVSKRERLQRAAELLEQVGLGERGRHLPSQLSGGQRQRVAIARSLANDPPVILADEPTGNLDSAAGAAVMESLRGLCRSGRTVVMVTHNPDFARLADRVITLRDGRIASDESRAG